MSKRAMIIYEIAYGIIYFGLLLSRSTLLSYFPNPTMVVRFIFLVVLFSGFFVPYLLTRLRIQLTGKHYSFLAVFICLMYICASWIYYTDQTSNTRFLGYHPFLQIKPPEHHAEIPKPKGLFRILCLGGSTTAGDYPAMLEKMLMVKYPGKKIEVINAGHYFYSTQHSIIQYLFYLKDLTPDLIIFFEGINDLITSFTMPPVSSSPFRKDYGHFYGALGSVRYPMTFERFILKFFYADLRQPDLKPTHFSDFKSQYSFRRNLETLVEFTRCEGIQLILSNQAHCFRNNNTGDMNFLGFPKGFLINPQYYADEKSWYEGMELFNRITKETFEKFSIPFVDQVAAFKGKEKLFTDGVHMNVEGTELKARLFFDKVVQLKFLEAP